MLSSKLRISLIFFSLHEFQYNSGGASAAPGLRAVINDTVTMMSPTKTSWKLWNSDASSNNLSATRLRVFIA